MRLILQGSGRRELQHRLIRRRQSIGEMLEMFIERKELGVGIVVGNLLKRT